MQASDACLLYTDVSFYWVVNCSPPLTGSLPGETVCPRAPRHISYGGTGDFSVMMDFLIEAFPSARFIGVGLSLGANILFKYLGEDPLRQQRFLGAQSWCQGYDAGRCFQAREKFGYATGIFYRLVAAKLKYNIRRNYLEKLFGPTDIAALHSSETSPVSLVHTYARVRDRKPGPIDPTRDANGYLLEGWEDIPPFDRRKVGMSGKHACARERTTNE